MKRRNCIQAFIAPRSQTTLILYTKLSCLSNSFLENYLKKTHSFTIGQKNHEKRWKII